MTVFNEKNIKNILIEKISGKRYQHSLRVADKARELALIYSAEPEKAYVAGLIHDYAKGVSGEDLIKLAVENNLITDPIEKEMPYILHGPVGAFLLKKEKITDDKEILSAVRNHTLGEIGMTLMDKIIYVADMVEPGRKFKDLEHLSQLANQDLDKALLLCLDMTIITCLQKSRLLHPHSIKVRNYYLKQS